MPTELRRTQAWHYSIFGTSAFLAAATAGKECGVDLFHYQTDDGRSMKDAVDYLAEFAAGEKEWPHQELYVGEFGEPGFKLRVPPEDGGVPDLVRKSCPGKNWPPAEVHGFLPVKLTPVLDIAATHYDDARYRDILGSLPPYVDAASRLFFR